MIKLYRLISTVVWVTLFPGVPDMILPTMGAPINIPLSALDYLVKYNYVHSSKTNPYKSSKLNKLSSGTVRSEALIDLDMRSIVTGIKLFQRFANLNVTGFMDKKTREAMTWPRCGVYDIPVDAIGGEDVPYEEMAGQEDDGGHQLIDDYMEVKRTTGTTKRRRQKRYAIQGSKWRKNLLTFKIDNYTKDIDVTVIDEQIRKALLVWSKHANLTFIQRYFTNADVVVSFEKFNHHDGEPFDGPGKVLAHAFFPQFGGDVHFDDSELWTTSPYRGSNLYQVAAHEFGHSLGLSHSSKRSSLMAPFYKTFMGTIELDYDDILGIQRLYGPPPNYYTMTTTTTKPRLTESTPRTYGKEIIREGNLDPRIPDNKDKIPPGGTGGGIDDTFFGILYPNHKSTVPEERDSSGGRDIDDEYTTIEHDLCKNPRLDAITTTAYGDTVAFRGKHYWQLNSYGIVKGFPRLISEDWRGLPNDLDAALSWGSKSNKTFFFKGSQYWRFSADKSPDPGYPKFIYKGFPGLPDNLDAAFVWSGNGMTYFIKGNQYWRYAGTSFDKVDEGYPKQLFIWQGLPVKIDAAMRWTNGKTYFFSGSKYYRFNDEAFKVDPTFPRSASLWWFGCFSNKYDYYGGRYDSLVAKPGSLNRVNYSIPSYKSTFPKISGARTKSSLSPSDEMQARGSKLPVVANIRAAATDSSATNARFESAYERIRNRGDYVFDPDHNSESVHRAMIYGEDEISHDPSGSTKSKNGRADGTVSATTANYSTGWETVPSSSTWDMNHVAERPGNASSGRSEQEMGSFNGANVAGRSRGLGLLPLLLLIAPSVWLIKLI